MLSNTTFDYFSFRDEYGAPENEPRHPDLGSGRPWPILAPEPIANDGD